MGTLRLKSDDGSMVDVDEDGNVTPVPRKPDPVAASTAQPGHAPVNYRPRDYTDEELATAMHDPSLGPSLLELANVPGRGYGGYRSRPGDPAVLRDRRKGVLDTDTTAQSIVAGAAAAPVAALAGAPLARLGMRAVAPVAAHAAGGAAASAAQGGNLKQNLIAAGIGGALAAPSAAASLIREAPAAVDARLPTAITGGARSKAAKSVVLGGAAEDAFDAHPELKKAMATSTDPAEQLAATNSTLNKLERPNSEAWDAIQKHTGGFDVKRVGAKLDDVAAEAKANSDIATMDAVESAKQNLERLADNGKLTANQMRNVRNALSARIETANPGTEAARAQQASVRKLHAAINDVAADVAEETPGVDAAAMRSRNKQIAQLLDVQKVLQERKLGADLKPFKNPIAKAVASAQHAPTAIAGLIDRADATIDAKLAGSPMLQRLAAGGRGTLNPSLTGAAAATGSRAHDIEFAHKVSTLMNGGKTLQEATREAKQ